jgi:hypothetical protein
MARAAGPERRTMPMPPRPGGVEMATMVSVSSMVYRVLRLVFFVMVGWACLLGFVRFRRGVFVVMLRYSVWWRWSGDNVFFRCRVLKWTDQFLSR